MKTSKKLNKIKHQSNLLSFLISQKHILNGRNYYVLFFLQYVLQLKTIKILKIIISQTIYLHIYI
jgi:hypothetical protein